MEKEIKKIIDLITRNELIEPLKIINTKYQDLLISRTIYGAIKNQINLCKNLCNYCNKNCKQGKSYNCNQFDANSEFIDIIINNIKNDWAVQAVMTKKRIDLEF